MRLRFYLQMKAAIKAGATRDRDGMIPRGQARSSRATIVDGLVIYIRALDKGLACLAPCVQQQAVRAAFLIVVHTPLLLAVCARPNARASSQRLQYTAMPREWTAGEQYTITAGNECLVGHKPSAGI